MRCPVCGGLGSRVIDSRSAQDGAEIRRRRECESCGQRFTTYERAERALPLVIKKDGRREPWDRAKLLRGLTTACEKRPVPIAAVEQLADAVAAGLSAQGLPEVPSHQIGTEVMLLLRELDKVAYVRFASVYRSFKDVGEFVSEIAALDKKGPEEG